MFDSNHKNNVEILLKKIEDAEAILVGAASGMSAACGFHFFYTHDEYFEKSGFAQEKTYEVEGNWFTMQCAKPCHDVIYPCSEQMEQMANAEEDGKIPEELVPHCPKCGGPMQIHMDGGPYFIPDITAKQRFQNFLDKYHEKKLVVLELGIGPRNQLIKVPLMNLVYREQNATYVTINLNEIFIPREIKSKSYGLDGFLDEILAQLRIACEE